MLKIRKAVPEDIERILEIYACAREVMKNSGNPDQWGDFQPPRELVEYDISVSRAYVMEEEKIHGVFVIIEGDDPLFLRASDINEELLKTVRALNAVAERKGQTLAQPALVWTFCDPVVTSALIGASKPEQVTENVKALNNMNLTKDELDEIDAILANR